MTGQRDVKALQGRDGFRLRIGSYWVIFDEDATTILAIYIGRRALPMAKSWSCCPGPSTRHSSSEPTTRPRMQMTSLFMILGRPNWPPAGVCCPRR